MFERGSDPTTRMLSGASYFLEVRKPGARKKIWVVLAALFLLLGAYFYQTSGVASVEVQLRNELTALKKENATLLMELGQVKMALEHERATRESLGRELAAQAESLKQANRNLSFYRSQSGRSVPVQQ